MISVTRVCIDVSSMVSPALSTSDRTPHQRLTESSIQTLDLSCACARATLGQITDFTGHHREPASCTPARRFYRRSRARILLVTGKQSPSITLISAFSAKLEAISRIVCTTVITTLRLLLLFQGINAGDWPDGRFSAFCSRCWRSSCFPAGGGLFQDAACCSSTGRIVCCFIAISLAPL